MFYSMLAQHVCTKEYFSKMWHLDLFILAVCDRRSNEVYVELLTSVLSF